MKLKSLKPAMIDLNMFQAMPGNVALLLPDEPKFTIVAATDGYLQTSGRAKEGLIGRGLFEAFPNFPDDPKRASETRLRSSLEHVIKHTEAHQLSLHRYDIQRPDGSFDERYWSATNKPVLDEFGELTYIIHAAEDVTERVKSEQREVVFQDLEKRYRELITAPILICILKGEDYRIAVANERTLDIWGRTADVIGKPLLQAMPELADQGFIELMDEVKRTGQPRSTFETPAMVFRNGIRHTYYLDFIFHPYYDEDDGNKATGIICVAHDVTEQARIRQQFKNVVERVPDPILILMGEELVLEVANQALFDLWQVGPESIGKPFLEILPEMKDQGFVELLKNVLHTGEPFYGNEVSAVFKRKNGREEKRTVNFAYQPYREADGSISGVLVTATDVTEQVIAKEKLQKSEQNLRNTILQSPVAMCILKGKDYVVEVANDRIYKLWGKGAEVMLNKPVFEGLPEARNQGLEQLLEHVYTSGETFTAYERPVELPRDGKLETVYLNFVYEPFRDNDGVITGIIAVGIDVTEQVKARKRVEESEKQFSTLANSIVQLAWIANGDGWIYWYNDRWYEYTGTTLEEMKGWGWQKVHHPDHIERVVTFAKEAWQKGESWELVFPLRRHDGTYRWFLTRGVPVKDNEGKVVQWIGTNTDIDDQKSVEAILEQRVQERTLELETQKNLLNNILVNSSNGISVTEMIRDERGEVIDARTILANDAAVNFTGLPKEVYLSKKATELDPNILDSPYGRMCLHTLTTGEPSFSQYRLEITGRWLELTVSKMDDDHLIHIFTDITSIKDAQLKLEQSVENLKRTNQNLEEFAYAASHDLKEPIRKIHFFTDRLRQQLDDKLEEEHKRIFNRLENASKRMGSLVDDLLAYSQATKGVREAADIDLNDIVRQVLEDLELEVQQKVAHIAVDYLPTIRGDQRQMRQLYQNLIGNALKYSKPCGTPKIKITSKKVLGREMKSNIPSEEANKYFYLIMVKDNGIGFAQEDAERIFNVFTRLHGDTEFRGTGIGLSIAQKVVQNHSGYIWAESKPGEGATFKVALPID